MWTPDRILGLLALSVLGVFLLLFFVAIVIVLCCEPHEPEAPKPLGKVVVFVLYDEAGKYYTGSGLSWRVADAVLFTVVVDGQDISCHPTLPIGNWKTEAVSVAPPLYPPIVVERNQPMSQPQITPGWCPPD